MNDVSIRVSEEIEKGNSWYVGSHFGYAQRPHIRPIYKNRYRYFLSCIQHAKARLGTEIRMLDAGCGDG